MDHVSAAGPGSSSLFAADQITHLSVGPVQAKPVIVSAGPQGEGSDGPWRSLWIVLQSRLVLNVVVALQLLEPQLQSMEFRLDSVGLRRGCAASSQKKEAESCCSKPMTQQSGEQLTKTLRSTTSVPAARSSKRWRLGPQVHFCGGGPW